MSVQGLAELNGALRITLADGIFPEGGQEFALISAVAGIGGQFDTVSADGLPTGIAWQIAYDPTSVRLQLFGNTQTGDYNGDGQVDAADYVVWRKTRGETGQGLAADGDGDGTVDDADYTYWRERFMQQVPVPQQSALGVPEPHGLLLGLALLLASGACRFRSASTERIETRSASSIR